MPTSGSSQASRSVHTAIKKGLLPPITKDTKCVDCGAAALVYDHRDYNRPLSVEPVCCKCNVRRGAAIPNTKYTRQVLSLLLFPKQVAALKQRQQRTGVTVSEQIRRAIAAYLKGDKSK